MKRLKSLSERVGEVRGPEQQPGGVQRGDRHPGSLRAAARLGLPQGPQGPALREYQHCRGLLGIQGCRGNQIQGCGGKGYSGCGGEGFVHTRLSGGRA